MSIIEEIKKLESAKDSIYGTSYRGAAILKDGTEIPCAYTGAIRTSIPALSGHPFRFNPDTDSGINQPVFC